MLLILGKIGIQQGRWSRGLEEEADVTTNRHGYTAANSSAHQNSMHYHKLSREDSIQSENDTVWDAIHSIPYCTCQLYTVDEKKYAL